MSEKIEDKPEPDEIEKPKRGRKLILILGGLLIFCCLGLGAVAIFSNSDSGDESDRQEVVEDSQAISSAGVSEQTDESVDNLDTNEQTVEDDQQEAGPTQEQEEELVSDSESTALPTAAPTETPAPTPTPLPVGLSRAQPFSPDETVSGGSWEIQILESLRGEEAWQQVAAANQYNDPPPEGMEYVLINVHAKNISTSDEASRISYADFNITGDEKILYDSAYISGPEPELEGELFAGGETQGWISYLVGEGEGNLILVLDELFSFDEDENRFVALEDGASVTVDQELYDLGETSLGLTRSEPAPLTETVSTNEFELTLKEVMRGDDVYNMLVEANQFNDPPDEGVIYLAAWIYARRIGTGDRALHISDYTFDPTGSSNVLFEQPSVVEPDDRLDAYLFPGGETEGWVVIQVPIDEENLMLAYEPLFSFTDEDLRFLAIDENASVEVPESLSSISDNGVGEEKSDPAELGETVITGNFEFTVTDVVRGNEALAFVQQADASNDPPDDGMEYVAVKMKVRRVNPNDDWISISGAHFDLTGDNGIVYDRPFVYGLEPRFDVRLYPDGEYEGWTVYQASEGESGLLLIFDTLFGIGERFFALE